MVSADGFVKTFHKSFISSLLIIIPAYWRGQNHPYEIGWIVEYSYCSICWDLVTNNPFKNQKKKLFQMHLYLNSRSSSNKCSPIFDDLLVLETQHLVKYPITEHLSRKGRFDLFRFMSFFIVLISESSKSFENMVLKILFLGTIQLGGFFL